MCDFSSAPLAHCRFAAAFFFSFQFNNNFLAKAFQCTFGVEFERRCGESRSWDVIFNYLQLLEFLLRLRLLRFGHWRVLLLFFLLLCWIRGRMSTHDEQRHFRDEIPFESRDNFVNPKVFLLVNWLVLINFSASKVTEIDSSCFTVQLDHSKSLDRQSRNLQNTLFALFQKARFLTHQKICLFSLSQFFFFFCWFLFRTKIIELLSLFFVAITNHLD